MRRLSSIAFLGLFTAASAFSSAPKQIYSASMTTATTRRQPFSRCQTLFPVAGESRPRNNFQSGPVTTRMTSDDGGSRSEEDKKTVETDADDAGEADGTINGGTNGDAAVVSTKDAEKTAKGDASKGDGGGFSLILLPTLLFKFTIVMCLKFATDVVVFPLLWLYRLVRLGKRKVLRGAKGLFGKKDDLDVGSTGVNGDGDASSSPPEPS